MKDNVIDILGDVNDKLWIVVTILIILVGIYFTVKLSASQFNFKKMYTMITKKEKNNSGISSFKTLMLSLAGRIGVGSISGVALAIYVGGPGTIFWIWVISLLSAPLAYSETYLGIKYKEQDDKGTYKGGPAYYIKKALKNYNLGVLYAVMIMICYVVWFIGIQSNTITKAVTDVVNINPIMVGLLLSIVAFLVIVGGVKKIADATAKIVPVMSLVYIGLAIFIIITNIKLIPSILMLIASDAFKFKTVTAGFFATMLMGIQRGIFSNEAGIGTGSIAASSGSSNDSSMQGYVQMIGIYITSFLICTATAIIILTSNYNTLNLSDLNGIEIATHAFKYHLGNTGNIILVISILLFAFSTILSGYYYGESSLKFLFKKTNKKYIMLLKISTALIIFFGSIFSPSILWEFTDVFVAFLALINIYAIYKLRNEIKS